MQHPLLENEIILKKNHAVIVIKDRWKEIAGCVKIDLEDVERIKGYSWNLNKRDMIVRCSEVGSLKRFLTKCAVTAKYKFLNGNKLDYRRSNLCPRHVEKREITTRTPNKIVLKDKYAVMYLRDRNSKVKGKTRIDLEDVERVSKHKWCLAAGYVLGSGDVGFLARFLMGAKDDELVDHKDLNPLNNRRKRNLRICDYSKNNQNRGMPSNNTSGAKGVSISKRNGAISAKLMVEGTIIRLGTFMSVKEASTARDKAAKKYHKEFARLNSEV